MASDPALPWTFLLAPAQQPLGALKPSLWPPPALFVRAAVTPPGWAVSTSVCQPMARCRLPGTTRCPPGHFSPKGDPVRIQQSPPAQHLVTTNLSVSVDLLLRTSHRGLLHDAAFGVWPLTQHPVLKAHRVLIRTIFRCVDRPHMFIHSLVAVLKLGNPSAESASADSLQSCPTLCDPTDCSPPGSSVHGDSPGRNTGVDCSALLQGIFQTQGSNLRLLCLLTGRCLLYRWGHPGSPALWQTSPQWKAAFLLGDPSPAQ